MPLRLIRPILLGVLTLAFAVAGCRVSQTPADPAVRAQRIHDRFLSIDTHCDTPHNLARSDWKAGEAHDAATRGGGQVDLPRMKRGRLDAEFFAAFVGQGQRTPEGYAKARQAALNQIEAVKTMCREYPNLVGLALTPDDALRLKREGRLIAFISMENGYPIGKDLSLIGDFHELGVRMMTLVHTRDNDICDSSTDQQDPEDAGLSAFGAEVVRACNRAGIIVDVSHASDESFYDVLRETAAPVVASHSCARAVCDNPRNLSDDMLRVLAKNGGVIQICFLSSYVKATPPNPDREQALQDLRKTFGSFRDIRDEATRIKVREAFEAVNRKYPETRATLKDLVDHIDHVRKVVGIDHVGIGTDFDGGGGVIGCNDAGEMFHVTEELLRRGYGEDEIAKIWSGNTLRVFRDVIKVARRLRADAS
ncbi:MAG: dipeptidase [Candidatus Aminicenantes bacterium]|nr:dipeptidase [Candidatus Aminicenantes bacterium]